MRAEFLFCVLLMSIMPMMAACNVDTATLNRLIDVAEDAVGLIEGSGDGSEGPPSQLCGDRLCGFDETPDDSNPGSVDLLDPDVVTPLAPAPIDPDSRGHVVVAFRNDTFFDEQLLQQLVANGLDEELLNDPEVRPRVRVRLRITFSNGEVLDTEFNNGSATIIDPREDASTFPELTRSEQTNLVVQCNVSRVELITLPSVFVPVFFETIRIDPGDANTRPFRVLVDTTNPRFELLEIDDVDAQGTTILQRNLDIRDVPGPAIGPNCGSVVTITLSGTLRARVKIS